MNAALVAYFSACLVAVAAAQEKPTHEKPATGASPAVPPLATSTQGQPKAPVDIVIALRHEVPGDAKCEGGANACELAEHWLVELQPSGGKPVLLTLQQQAELQKELKSAGNSKARKLGVVTISDATVSLQVPVNTPFARVQALLLAVANAGIHKTEFAVASADKGERRLAVPLPTDTGAPAEEEAGRAAVEEVRVALFWDKAKGEAVRKFGSAVLHKGARGDVQLLELIKDSMEGWRRLGKPDTPGVIDATGAVPWQAVVQTLDAFRAAGVQNIQFTDGKTRKSAPK